MRKKYETLVFVLMEEGTSTHSCRVDLMYRLEGIHSFCPTHPMTRMISVRSDRDDCRLVARNNQDLFQVQQWIRRRSPVDLLWRAHRWTNNKPARWRASQDEQGRYAWLMCMCIENYWLFFQLTKKEVTISRNHLQNKYENRSQMNAIQRKKLHGYAERKMFTESIIMRLMWKIASLCFSSLDCQQRDGIWFENIFDNWLTR